MLTVEQISYYAYPHVYICSHCNSETTLKRFGVSVAGAVTVETECQCGRQATIYVDFDELLYASQQKLLEKLRKGDFHEQPSDTSP